MFKSNGSYDQAEGLRRMTRAKTTQVLAITSGKGGVGKTSVSVNLGVAISRCGKSVMIMDADLGLANVDILLGLQPRFNLSHVIEQKCKIRDVIVQGPAGIRIVPGSSGIMKMASLGPVQQAALINAFNDVGGDLDVLLVDTSAGISESVFAFVRACQEVVVVVCDEPASITDSYALIKVLSRDYEISRFHILPNMVPSVQKGRELFTKLTRVTDRYLDVVLDFMGVIPEDHYVRKAIQEQQSVVERFPGSRSAMAFRRLAKETDCWQQTNRPNGHFQFFLDRLIRTDADNGGLNE